MAISFDPTAYTEALSDLQLAHETLNRSPKENWVDKAGGLPQPIVHMAKDIHEEKGMPISQAIAIAVSQAKKLAAKGNAKYIKAVAEWEKMKAKSHANNLSAVVAGVDFDAERFELALSQARLELATFDEAKHPRLKGKFIRVGHVLKDTAGKNYRVEKINKDAIHVRQLRTSPGQEHHDPTDTPLGGLHKIESGDIPKVFKEHAVTKTKEDVQANKDLQSEMDRQKGFKPGGGSKSSDGLAPGGHKKGDHVQVTNADGSKENGIVKSVSPSNVKVTTAEGDDYNYDHHEVTHVSRPNATVGGDSSRGRKGERVAGDRNAPAIPATTKDSNGKITGGHYRFPSTTGGPGHDLNRDPAKNSPAANAEIARDERVADSVRAKHAAAHNDLADKRGLAKIDEKGKVVGKPDSSKQGAFLQNVSQGNPADSNTEHKVTIDPSNKDTPALRAELRKAVDGLKAGESIKAGDHVLKKVRDKVPSTHESYRRNRTDQLYEMDGKPIEVQQAYHAGNAAEAMLKHFHDTWNNKPKK